MERYKSSPLEDRLKCGCSLSSPGTVGTVPLASSLFPQTAHKPKHGRIKRLPGTDIIISNGRTSSLVTCPLHRPRQPMPLDDLHFINNGASLHRNVFTALALVGH